MNLRSHLGSMFAPLLIHGLNQNEAIARAKTAEAAGLDPNTFGTAYPGSKIDQTVTNNKANWLGPAVLGAALLASGMGGALLIPGLLAKPVNPQPVPPAQQTAPTTQPAPSDPAPAQLNPWDEIQEVLQPDGSFKEKPGSRKPFGKFPKDWLPPDEGVVP